MCGRLQRLAVRACWRNPLFNQTPSEPQKKEKQTSNMETATQPNIPDQLLKLKDLRDIGAITEEEYNAKRRDLLNKYR